MNTWRRGLIFIILLLTGCQLAPIIGGDLRSLQLADGVYRGTYRNGPNSAVVEVVIANNRLEDVVLIRHFSSWKGGKANRVIPERILTQLSTRVDVVSGATNSSIVIMNAAQKAIDKAYK